MTWFALIAKPQAEALALRCVRARGYEAWMPEAIVERRMHHVGRPRVEAVTVALFGGYLFAKLAEDQALEAALSAPGVFNVVRTRGGMCLPMTDRVIERLQERLAEGPIDLRPRTISQHFNIGQRVSVAVGPHAGLVGIVEQVIRGNVTLALDILGRRARMSAPITAVRASA